MNTHKLITMAGILSLFLITGCSDTNKSDKSIDKPTDKTSIKPVVIDTNTTITPKPIIDTNTTITPNPVIDTNTTITPKPIIDTNSTVLIYNINQDDINGIYNYTGSNGDSLTYFEVEFNNSNNTYNKKVQVQFDKSINHKYKLYLKFENTFYFDGEKTIEKEAETTISMITVSKIQVAESNHYTYLKLDNIETVTYFNDNSLCNISNWKLNELTNISNSYCDDYTSINPNKEIITNVDGIFYIGNLNSINVDDLDYNNEIDWDLKLTNY